jgi:hypothetical protein
VLDRERSPRLFALRLMSKYRPMPSPISPVLKIISLKVSYLRAEWCSVVKGPQLCAGRPDERLAAGYVSCAPGAIMAFLSFTTEHHSARRYDTFKEMILSTGLIFIRTARAQLGPTPRKRAEAPSSRMIRNTPSKLCGTRPQI